MIPEQDIQAARDLADEYERQPHHHRCATNRRGTIGPGPCDCFKSTNPKYRLASFLARLLEERETHVRVEQALEEAMGYARDRKLECRRDAASQGTGFEFIGMANAFAEMAEHLHRALTEARLDAANPQ